GERFAKDIELSRVEAPRAVLRDASLFVEVVVVQRGFGGSKIPVVVEDSGRIVGSTTVTLPRDGEAIPVRIRIPARETGARLLRVNIPVQAGELVKENNERYTLVVVRDRREKVLYLEGEPRWELKFLRKAVESDGNVQLVTLLRSAKDKYLRLGVDDSLELATGFPKTREELFSYRAIVLGSIEASFFTADQLRMLADFVSERGGGILFLGGRESLGEGGFGGTAVSDVLPVDVVGSLGDAVKVTTVRAVPTVAGSSHPALQIAPGDSSSTQRWLTLPALTTVNRVGRAKPGATVLLNGKEDDPAGTVRPLLAYQRYGRGKSIVFAVQDDWIWQMDASINPEDMTHETFWRQMLRWLVSDVPDRVEASMAEESGTGEAIPLRAEVSDAAFLKANGASVRGMVRAPSGKTQDVALEWAVDRDGEYRTTYVPDENGVHSLQLQAIVGRDTLKGEPAYVRVAPPTTEYFGAEMRSSLLREIAEETGGRYYTADRAGEIARDMVYSASGATVVQKRDLWDMPIVFLLLLGALGGEWLLRRRRGLA
ncbi:MAG: glutamine amidotransferase, partial [Gemmatimonadaceae bacterium]